MKKIYLMTGLLLLATIFATNTVFAGNIVISGSNTMLHIAQKLAEAYMKEHPDVKISVSGTGSGNGIKALIDSTTDIADSSRAIKPEEEQLAKEKGVNPAAFIIAYDALLPIVHPSNPIKDITMDQLKAIYKGDVKNRKDAGGADKTITVVSRYTSSGTYEIWEEKVMKKDRVHPGAILQESTDGIVQYVSENPNAIGYIGIGYLNNKVKALSVNGIVGSKETALSGKFPISRPLFMYTKGQPVGEIKDFIDYVLNKDKGQKQVEESGFVPLQ